MIVTMTMTKKDTKSVLQSIVYSKVCTLKNNTDLNSSFCLIKSSKIVLIFLPAFYLSMWLMTSKKNFEKIAILKI